MKNGDDFQDFQKAWQQGLELPQIERSRLTPKESESYKQMLVIERILEHGSMDVPSKREKQLQFGAIVEQLSDNRAEENPLLLRVLRSLRLPQVFVPVGSFMIALLFLVFSTNPEEDFFRSKGSKTTGAQAIGLLVASSSSQETHPKKLLLTGDNVKIGEWLYFYIRLQQKNSFFYLFEVLDGKMTLLFPSKVSDKHRYSGNDGHLLKRKGQALRYKVTNKRMKGKKLLFVACALKDKRVFRQMRIGQKTNNKGTFAKLLGLSPSNLSLIEVRVSK